MSYMLLSMFCILHLEIISVQLMSLKLFFFVIYNNPGKCLKNNQDCSKKERKKERKTERKKERKKGLLTGLMEF